MPNAIDAAYEQAQVLRWVVDQARDRALPDPPLAILLQLRVDTELATPTDVRRGVERVFDELDVASAQVGFLLVVHAFEAHVKETLKSVADEMRLLHQEGRYGSGAALREGLVGSLSDLRSLGRISEIIGPLIPDRRLDLKAIIEQRNQIAHGAERGAAPSITVDQAFDILSVVAAVCSAAATDAEQPEAPQT